MSESHQDKSIRKAMDDDKILSKAIEDDRKLRRAMEDEHRKMLENDKIFLNLRANLSSQEKEFEEYRSRLRNEHLSRERALQKELKERETLFAEREKNLVERQLERENQLARRQGELEALKERLSMEIIDKEAKLAAMLVELQQEKDRYNQENRKRIEKTSSDYVSESLEVLALNEKKFHNISRIWSIIGACALVVGIGFIIYVTLDSLVAMPSVVTWQYIFFITLKGAITVGLLAALSRYSFIFSQSYMRESLKNADRRHAINFGKFYLQSYGAAADWSQVQEAFKHWNTSGDNAFSSASDEKSDFTSLGKAITVIEDAAKTISKKTNE